MFVLAHLNRIVFVVVFFNSKVLLNCLHWALEVAFGISSYPFCIPGSFFDISLFPNDLSLPVVLCLVNALLAKNGFDPFFFKIISKELYRIFWDIIDKFLQLFWETRLYSLSSILTQIMTCM